jgi:tripartite-type tricarboxylate transporter receptor subunit TctC
MKPMHLLTFSLVALASAPLASLAQDAAQPPLKMIVPYSPGGTTDYVARLLQKPLSEIPNRTVVVENKPGAAGTIGTDMAAKATPDGNTIVFGNQGPNAIVPAVRKTPYDPLEDLRPLTTVTFHPLLLAVSAERGPKTLKEAMQQARAPGSQWTYGSSGIGSLAHITGHEFARAGGLEMLHVPYQGGGPVMTAILKGDIHASFVTGAETAALVRSGKLRYIGVAAPKRLATLPDVPTIAEEVPGFESVLWYAVFAPKGTPDAIAARLRNAIVKAVERPEFRKRMEEGHSEARSSTPEELTELVKRDMARWGGIVRRAKIPM